MSKPVHGPRANDLKLQAIMDDVITLAYDHQSQWDEDTASYMIQRGLALATLGYQKLKVRIEQIRSGHNTTEIKLEKKIDGGNNI